MFLVGSVRSVESHTILRSYVRSYHFYDPSAILIVLVRWDRKIVRSYDPDRNFDNHGPKTDIASVWQKKYFCRLIFTMQLIFSTIHGSHYTISANFYFYL